MSNTSDFVIEKGVLKKYVGPGGDVVVPEGVTEIGENVFVELTNVSIHLPVSIQKSPGVIMIQIGKIGMEPATARWEASIRSLRRQVPGWKKKSI